MNTQTPESQSPAFTPRGSSRAGAIVALSALILLAVLAIVHRERKSSDNPYAYDLSPWSAPPAHLFSHAEGRPLSLSLDRPMGIALDREDILAVVGARAAVLFDRDFREIRRFPLAWPGRCAAWGPSGELLVGFSNRVAVYDRSGNQLAEWPDLGERARLTSLAVTPGAVFAADAGQRLVWCFGPDGALVGMIGRKNVEAGESGFVVPSEFFDVAPGFGNSFWVVDPGRHRIQQRSLSGAVLYSWGQPSMAWDGFSGC